MNLLHNSGIEIMVKSVIRGEVARVGGSCDQLVNYKNVTVQDINILDGGFGSIKSIFHSSSFRELRNIVTRRMKQEVKHILYGNRITLDRKTIELDLHFAQQRSNLHRRFDATISSNVIEHSPNVIFFLLNFHFLTKADGWLFHALPNYRYTYDRFRSPTTLQHFIRDFETRQAFTDETHHQDYIQSAIEKDGWQRDFHKEFPVAYPYMHFHVFDEINTQELFEMLFEEVTVDVIRNDRFSDNVVLCRNKLNQQFSLKYADLIAEVKDGSYLSCVDNSDLKLR